MNWTDEFNGAVTVCDRKGIVVYMNEISKKQFIKYGGDDLIGKSLIDCHPEPARKLLLKMLEKPIHHAYTTEKAGKRKQIYQTPWMENGEFKGVVEISFELPSNMVDHQR